MTRKLAMTLLPLLGAVATPFFTGGCLITSDSEQRRSGNYVADSTFSQIEPGRTTAGWVRGTLGPPTAVTPLDDGSQIWKYTYTERHESSGSLFLIFGGHDARESDHTAFVEMRDGRVVRAWRG